MVRYGQVSQHLVQGDEGHDDRTGEADVVGDLTLHGTTKPVVLHAVFHGAGVNPLNKHYTVGFDAAAKIKRTEFGVSTLVPLISDDVDIVISAAFERQNFRN